MTYFFEALSWFMDESHWFGMNGITTRLWQHLWITFVAVGIAALLALPTGVAIGHSRRGAGVVGAIAGAARALPTLGLLTLFGLALGIGVRAPIIALVILAIPSLLTSTYAGIQAIDPTITSASRALGYSTPQMIFSVELPLALPLIIGGIRAATLQVAATATLAAYTADVGLGRYIFAGLKTRDYPYMLAGALLVIIVAIVLELFLSTIQRIATRQLSPTSVRK